MDIWGQEINKCKQMWHGCLKPGLSPAGKLEKQSQFRNALDPVAQGLNTDREEQLFVGKDLG